MFIFYLNHLGGGPALPVLGDHIVEEDDLGQLHRDVVLVRAGLEVGDHGGPDAERGDGDAGEDHVLRPGRGGVHEEEADVGGGDALEEVEHLERVEHVDEARGDHGLHLLVVLRHLERVKNNELGGLISLFL